jgi:hypothetical protein
MKRKSDLPVMTLSEAGRMVLVNPATFWRWAKSGKIPVTQIGGKIFVLRKEFLKLFDPRKDLRRENNEGWRGRTANPQKVTVADERDNQEWETNYENK